MALTISAHPDEVITIAPEFTVTTSLTEGASYQNLRIRATIYIGGESSPVAVLEQPKGLDDWDFLDLLKSLIGKCNEAVGGSAGYTRPTMGSELLTGWTDVLSTFETFTTSGRQISSAIDSNASGGLAASNDLGAISAGDIIVVGVMDGYSDAGAAEERLQLHGTSISSPFSETNYAGLSSGELQENHIYLFHATQDDTISGIAIGHGAGANGNFSGIFQVHKISDFKNNPGIYFHIKFEEVYENASDVTTIGAESWSDTLLFVPIDLHPGESFSDYLAVATGASGKALVRSTEHPSTNTFISANKMKAGIGMECRVMYLSVCPEIQVMISTALHGPLTLNIENPGWFMLILNDLTGSAGWAGIETYFFWTFTATTGGFASAVQVLGAHYIYEETNCFQETKAINFVSRLGEETLLFKALPSKYGKAEKSFYKDVNRIDRVLKAYRKMSQILRTRYETEVFRELLHELIYSELPVWMFDTDEASGYKEVTVLDDEVPISDQDELIDNEVVIEYYE
jgi:hypothetical protein